jgi:hypothetical protein
MRYFSCVLAAVFCGMTAASAPAGMITIVEEKFDGLSSVNLNTTSADTFAPAIVTAGGSANWTGSTLFKADGSFTGYKDARSIHLSLGDYINEARGTPEGLFELAVTISETTGNWLLSIGFNVFSAPSTTSSFLTGGRATMAYRPNGDIDQWAGPGNANEVAADDKTYARDRRLTITLDLRDWDGSTNFGTARFGADVGVGGAYQEFGSFNYTSEIQPYFRSIMLCSSDNTTGTYSDLTLRQIPEPSGGLLLLLGAMCTLLVRRRRGTE